MKGETAFVPIQPCVRDKTPGLALEIADDVLVTHLQHGVRRKDAAPMRHEPFIRGVVPPEFREIVGVRLTAREEFGETRKTCVDRIAADMDDARVRKRHADKTDKAEIRRHFVGYPFRIGRERTHLLDIGRTELAQAVHGNRPRDLGKIIADCPPAERASGFGDIRQFSGAMNGRMTGENLLDQRGARPRHSHDEDRHIGRIAGLAQPRQRILGERTFDKTPKVQCRRFVIFRLRALQGVSLRPMAERGFVFADVRAGFAQCEVQLDTLIIGQRLRLVRPSLLTTSLPQGETCKSNRR